MRRIKFLICVFGILTLTLFLSFWELDQVDLEASEDIYVSDAVGYLRKDPFTAPRQHLRKPHAPASPHPFLYQMILSELFKFTGLSLFSARLLSALSFAFSISLLMYLTQIMNRSYRFSLITGFMFISIPLVTRFGRMAILDPLLMLIQILGMIWLWLYLNRQGVKGYVYALLVGIALGLSISAKLTGIFYFIPIFLLMLIYYLKTRQIFYIISFILILGSCFTVFISLNDPYSYYYGWTHFSDPKYRNISFVSTFKGFVNFPYWALFIKSLFGITNFFLLLGGSIYVFYKRNDKRILFILMWILAPLTYLVLNPPHVTGLSAEWSYLPLMPPVAIILAWTFWKCASLLNKHNKLLFLSLLAYTYISILPVFWYGLRFKQLPLATFLGARNVVRKDLAVTKIIQALNEEHDAKLVLINVKGMGFPLWLLKDEIKTEPFYHKLSAYDHIVTDDFKLVQMAQTQGFMISLKQKNPSEREIVLLKSSSQF